METKIREKYESWINEPTLTQIEKAELSLMKDDEIISCFGSDLEFGTAGIRGVMGVGTNRMNKYVVRQATQGLTNYLKETFEEPSVAIAFDSRNNSELFAKETATVLAANGIKVFIYKEIMPVPALSFAVRELKCSAGIVITASHNPKQYNGYKVYGSDGCQITTTVADAVLAKIKEVDIFKGFKNSSFVIELSDGNIHYISHEIIEKYYESVLAQSVKNTQVSPRILNISYTPLHGSGLIPVTEVLARDGFENIHIVEEQKNPDGDFTTCEYPNPELLDAMKLGINLMLENNDDILVATDPDSDRAGVVVNQNGTPKSLTGNEVGILLFDFIRKGKIEEGTMPANPVVIKTIVSSDLINIIAENYSINVIEVLTGFKYIGEQIHLLETQKRTKDFLLGFEESCGYLTNPAIRDKDAVNAILLIAEMANYYKHQGITLIDRLNEIYEEFGAYKTSTLSYEFSGVEGKQKISDLMVKFRDPEIQKSIGKVQYIGDYKLQKLIYPDKEEPTNLPAADVIKLFLENHETITIRPSGTEPKIKAYIFANGETRLEELKDKINSLIK